ncbi:TRAP transporter large permease [Phyllobacterium sp. 0TCS1.6C]|uniref:TRAP transporter large permease n=1 Tax=unclassified Phyllobacterium TaxID=2638441 RepID=UPI002263EAFE|nr:MULTISPECIES: TRAP transporter large permease [unclassified Phyllobacterium]MCX8282125.1 TRAP transporter large permease [Phyllobacterium sp. 0TCS1.6C]MCX8296333.1 TRAP transporter large permease [Phyllobacterium sp. 0TCS1.6A]
MITFSAMALLMLIGLPISIVLCLTAVAYIWQTDNSVLFVSFPTQMFTGLDSYGLIAIPLFILIGEIMNGGGITRRIIDMAMAFVGALKGGLAYVNLLANMFVASILGSAAAQVALMSQMVVPEMERKGYDKTFAAGLTAYAGMLGPIIPPSIMFVVYSVIAQVPVGTMLAAGIIPGLLLSVAFCAIIALMGFIYNYPRGERLAFRRRVEIVVSALPTLTIPLIIVGSIVTGIANPTEAAAMGVVAAIFVGRFVTKDLSLDKLPSMFVKAGVLSAGILFLIAAAAVFSWVLVYGMVPQRVAAWIQTIASDPIMFMLLVNVILLVIGTVIDGAPGLIMTVPILLPIATGVYGIDPVHFGVVAVINLVLGFLSPPVGLNFFIASAVTGAKPGKMFIVTLPFFFISCIILVLLSIFPVLSTYFS